MRKNNQLSIFILILTGMLSTLCLLTEAIAQDRMPICPPLGKTTKLIKPLREILFIGTLSFFLFFFVFLLIVQQSKRHFAESLTIVA